MHIAFIGIGSNLGDRQKNCEDAIALLEQNPPHPPFDKKGGGKQDGLTKLLIKSRWYETVAVVDELLERGNPQTRKPVNPPFINGVIKIETNLSPADLLRLTQSIETKLGRVRTGKKWESRTIDLDILFYDDLIMDTPELKIPHPELHKRMFVLEPLCNIAPAFVHPVLKKTIKILHSTIFLESFP